MAVLALIAPGCTSDDNNATSVLPQVPPASSLPAVSGTLVGLGGAAPPKMTIQVFENGTTLLGAFTTTSQVSGRWSVRGLSPGTYRFKFIPPTPDPNDPSTNLRSIDVGNVVFGSSDLSIPPVFFAPVVDGGLLIRDNDTTNQQLKFRRDPKDTGSALVPGLENMELLVRAGTVLKLFGFTLAQLGIDDDTTTSTTRELLVEVALIRPDQLPAPHIDENGDARASQIYYQLYPVGYDFLTTGTLTRELEVDFPNFDGLSRVYETPQVAYSSLTSTWNPAGVVDVAFSGVLIEADNFDGPKQLGLVVAAGPPPPTTNVTGQLMSNGNPLLRAGIAVRTNSGFTGFTDAAGVYRIEDVPIPLHRADLAVTAFADSGLEFAMASSVARPTYPTTTIDISLPAIPVLATNCILANSEPIIGAVGVQTNARIRLRFDGRMDPDSLQSAFTVVATPTGQSSSVVPGMVVTEELDVGGGILHTDAYFLADDPLPTDASITVSVSTAATNQDGLPLAAACSFSFQTGTSTLLLPRIDVIEPVRGTVGQTVTLYGINMDLASVSFDGASVTASNKTTRSLTFTVPTSEGAEAPGPRVVSVIPGPVTESFDILPRIDSIQFDDDPDTMVENLVDLGAGAPGTAVAGVDQNDGTLIVIQGQNLFDPGSGSMPLVTFGRGDGTAAGSTDGDADIDGPDESAAVQRIDVNVPPQATAGDLTVTVDIGGGMSFSSAPVTFLIDLPEDMTAPVFDMPGFVPQPNATGVASNTIIRIPYNEAVSGISRLVVGSGTPARQLPGETRVTTSLDGTQGFLEFLPAAGSLPLSSTIQVQLSQSLIFDLAGNPSASFDYTFATGATEPSGGNPPSLRTDLETTLWPVQSELAQPDSSQPDSALSELPGTTPSEDEPGAVALGLRSSASPDHDASASDAAETELIAGIVQLFFDSKLSVEDGTIDDWGDLLPVASWPASSVQGEATVVDARALYLADNWGYGADGEPRVESFFRFDLAGATPDPEHHAFRFRLSMADGAVRTNGMVTDLDQDGRYELSLFSDSASGPSALGRTDLVQVGEGFLELKLPVHTPPQVEGEGRTLCYLSIQSFDLRASTCSNSPVIQFEY